MDKQNKFKGVILIIIGILIAGRVFGLLSFSLMFPGWWTLFIIIPNLIGFCSSDNSREDRGNNFFWFSVGIMLLLRCMKLLSFKLMLPLIIADLFICNGIKNMLPDKEKERKEKVGKSRIKYYYGENGEDFYPGDRNRLADEFEESLGIRPADNEVRYREVEKRVGEYVFNEQVKLPAAGNNMPVYDGSGERVHNRMHVREKISLTAILSGKELRLGREVFQGGSINTVLGGIEIDLENAIIREDIRIDVNVLLGGVDIKLPDNVRVVVTTTDILGGVGIAKRFKKVVSEYAPTVYIGGSCILGGIDIK